MTGIKGITTTTTLMNRSMTIGMSILLIQILMTTTLDVRYSIIAMVGVGHRRCEVRNNDDVFHKLKFKIPPFDGKYDPDAYIS
jgi:hypothetical protein